MNKKLDYFGNLIPVFIFIFLKLRKSRAIMVKFEEVMIINVTGSLLQGPDRVI